MKFLLSLLVILFSLLPLKAQILLNEFQANNVNFITDPDYGEYTDWVEIYNSGKNQVDLSGWTLNDLPIPNDQWQFPNGTIIQEGGFLLVWMDNKNVGFHANFKLKSEGESLFLFDDNGEMIDSINYESQEENISFGRTENQPDQWGYFYSPTPLAPNLTKYISQPFQGVIFSHEEGFYDQSITLTLTSNNPDAIIKYTRNGSTPGMASLTYQNPIQLSSPTVIRAVEVVNGIIPKQGQTRMFIVNHPQSGLPVISLTTDPVNLWDDTQGIYVTGTNGIRGNGPETDPPRNWNQDWERPTLMTYFDENGEIQIKQQVGIKIFGGWSRAFDQKSLSIFARKKYGKGSLDYRFFKEKNIESFETINLRNSGNDWSGSDGTMMRDGVLQNIGIGRMNIDYQAYQPAEVYLNGEYWGIHNIREKLNEHYAADNHQENRDAIDLLEGYGTVNSGSDKDYFEMINWLENHHLSSAQNYQEAAEMIDIDHFIDYQIIQIYIDNRDWPGNNIKFWKPHRVGGKWRWILFDTDFGFGIWGQSPADNTIRFAREPNNTGWPNPSWSTFIFRKLLENNQFRLTFAQRFNYHLNTTFKPERVISIIDSLQTQIQPAIERHLGRWGGNSFSWNNKIESMRNYAKIRPQYVKQHLRSEFSLASPIAHILAPPDSTDGYITLDNEKITQSFEGSWYRQIPSKLFAFPARGKAFSHWVTGSVKNQTLISQGTSWKYWDQATTPTGDWKASVFDDSGWGTGNAQLGYGDGDEATEISFGGDPGNKIPSALFRKKFIILNKHSLSDFEIHLLRDDGAMVYLNGQEIIRSNMPNGSIQRDTYALESIFDDGENTFHTFKVDSSLFLEGENTLAVSIHQISAESSDLSFDLYLTAIEEGDSISTLFSQNLDLPLNEESRISPVFTEAKPVISEILYYPEINKHPAFIEICNPATTVYDLSHYQLEGLNFVFPSGVQLLPDECLIVTENASMYQNQGYQVFQADSGILEAQGQEILLKDNTGKTIDSVAYQNQVPWPAVNVSGNSIELNQLQLDNNEGDNWAFNAREGGSPGIFNPVSSVKGIRINEVMSTNESNIIDSEGEYEDWIEIYNHNDFPVNLGGMYLTDRKDNLLKWMIPVGHKTATTVPPKGHFIIYADGNPESGPNHLGFSISSQGEFLALTDPQSLIVDSLTLPPLTENQSFGRTSDGAVSMTIFEAWSTTPKSANSTENTPPQFISEPVTEILPGNNYHYEIEILDNFPEEVRITAECLPQWLQLIDYQNGKGNISGNITRNHIGQYRIILKAEDNYLNSYSLQEYILTIKDPVDEIAISSENGIVYPNPSDGFIHFIYPTPAGSEVLLEFFDLSGKTLVNKTHLSAGDFFKIPIDISSFAPGVYFMRVRVNKQIISTHKIIKL